MAARAALGIFGKRVVIGAVACTAAAFALLRFVSEPDAPPPHDAGTAVAAKPFSALALPAAVPAAAVPAEHSVTPGPRPRASSASRGLELDDVAEADPEVSKAARVEALSRSGKPEDAYAAYKLLAACDFAQNFERVDDGEGEAQVRAHVAALRDACGDLSPGQLSGRVRLLELAVAAHVSGAAADLVSQGPNGEPVSEVWDDPAYADWRHRTLEAVKAEAARGDPTALILMNSQYDHGGTLDAHDGALAIQYWVAYADVNLMTDPRYADPQRRRSFDEGTANIIARYSANLTPEQTAAAVAAGHALVKAVKNP
jgi:hypothetical protein